MAWSASGCACKHQSRHAIHSRVLRESELPPLTCLGTAGGEGSTWPGPHAWLHWHSACTAVNLWTMQRLLSELVADLELCYL